MPLSKIHKWNSAGVAKRLRQICSNDSDFQEQSKNYSAYLATRNHITKSF